eukprot:7138132-Prymnesium_polylepis.1
MEGRQRRALSGRRRHRRRRCAPGVAASSSLCTHNSPRRRAMNDIQRYNIMEFSSVNEGRWLSECSKVTGSTRRQSSYGLGR